MDGIIVKVCVRCGDIVNASVADYVLTDLLLPNAKTQGSPLQKSWNMVKKALTTGMQCSYTFFTNTGARMHTDFVLPYIRDVILERGSKPQNLI